MSSFWCSKPEGGILQPTHLPVVFNIAYASMSTNAHQGFPFECWPPSKLRFIYNDRSHKSVQASITLQSTSQLKYRYLEHPCKLTEGLGMTIFAGTEAMLKFMLSLCAKKRRREGWDQVAICFMCNYTLCVFSCRPRIHCTFGFSLPIDSPTRALLPLFNLDFTLVESWRTLVSHVTPST